ncbi:N-acetylmuramoyl-L-alanine amidase [Alkalicoccus luteus]|uniref:MurNAc-LAA domain-containing protein n=1 Tax=Alkalicoccus luteus TaxID=1237094 RepID=A0A969PYL3_9BACI|nr:N-acetylmuramoyl-L-alanine amidase [Alkalicoccus luteus]NJP37937.1 hypothetical protein [Alkalicoccus luteus]
MAKVYLDPGHGGHDPGAVGNGLREKDLVLQIALKTRAILQNQYNGATVRMSRTTDTFVGLNARAQDAVNWGADLFCSIHLNGAAAAANGTETFKHPSSTASRPAQRNLHDAILGAMRRLDSTVSNRGLKDGNFAVLRGTYTRMLSVLTEALFITNTRDANLLKRSGTLDRIAEAHAEGIAKTLGLSRKSGSSGGSGGSAPRYGPNNESFASYHSEWWGAEGEHIRAIQRLLQLAKELPLGSADGRFGQVTLDAVRSFQDKHNLSSAGQNFYGVPGPKTTAKLAEVSNTTDGLPGDMVRVTADRVNYRSRANWDDSAVAGSVSKGESFTIVRRAIMSNGSDLYQIKSGNFISVHPNFVEVVK